MPEEMTYSAAFNYYIVTHFAVDSNACVSVSLQIFSYFKILFHKLNRCCGQAMVFEHVKSLLLL